MSSLSKPASDRQRPDTAVRRDPESESEPELDPVVEATGTVVVGIDGSDYAEHALRWAINKTGTMGQVVPVSVFQPPSTFDLLTRNIRSTDQKVYREAAEVRLRAAVAATDPRLEAEAKVLEAHPGPGLVEAARGANLLVVGTRGHSGVSAALLGSVSSYCVSNSTVPVVVIPPDRPADKRLETVVVGIDGSANADAALRWAIEHADPAGTVVAAGAGSVYGYMGGEFDPSPAVLSRQIRELVEAAVARAGVPLGAGPKIVVQIDPNDARVALPRLATRADADLLVLGSRGMTGISYLLLGSVSTALVHHPVVPTVIVPPTSETDDPDVGGSETGNPERENANPENAGIENTDTEVNR